MEKWVSDKSWCHGCGTQAQIAQDDSRFTTYRAFPIVQYSWHTNRHGPLFPRHSSRSGLVCFIFLCGGDSCLLHNASKCHSSGTEINQRFIACGNPKQLWFSIVHTFTVDAFSTRQRREICCNWAVSVRSMAATFQQFDQMLDWNWNPVEDHRRSISGRTPSQPTVWTLHEIHEHSPLQWLCLGLVFWFCERVYLAALVAEEQWRRSVPSKRDI